ncbi:MAG: Sjogren's syndrome/scleroderma autoantigen 1 family protein [Candidatus Nitrosopelagicus sp.]|jgi:UPF0148 protein|nr:Sjogren's syndrome/scleroderma autoantigen 1 family protein [Candidatus Nitrosopelagicus sp.]
MSNELTKKAAEMLLNGATLLSEPCPYCKGVRVMKDGNALCVNCGKKPEEKHEGVKQNKESGDNSTALMKLEEKLDKLTEELSDESNHEKQESLLRSINSLVEIIKKMKD